jgi:two-component system sensor histidine kinase AlgZ
VVVGELLALVLVLDDPTSTGLSWSRFGAVSMIIQWIVLCSTLGLCQLRNWLNQLPTLVGGTLAYGLYLSISGIVFWAAQIFPGESWNSAAWLKSMVIAAIFSGILLRYLYVQQQLINQQQAESQARIEALQARIRPHFLFNSMNTIASLIPLDPQAAEKTVEDLSALFRASLQQPTQVPLAEEMALCQRYIAIEHIRLGERLQVIWHHPDPLPNTTIPSLLIQPLIENAIGHGIQRLPQGGCVTISISQQQQVLIIQISNPVVDASQGTNNTGNRIALENIRHRLQALYGKQARLTFTDNNHDYTVTIRLPITEPSTTFSTTNH